MKQKLFKLLNLLKTHKGLILFFGLIFLIGWVNTLHFQYTDEFDNISGGHFILQGILPYKDFFSAHGPFAYFYAAFISIFSGASFVNFRLFLAVFNFLFYVSIFWYLLKRFPRQKLVFLAFILYTYVMATFVWAHMLLADSLAGMLIFPFYILIFLAIYTKQRFNNFDLIILALLSALTLLTSLTYMYAIAIGYLFIVIHYVTHMHHRIFSLRTLKIFGLFLSPYLIYLIYLILSGSLFDYYYQSIFYVQKYYLSGYGDDIVTNNPIRYAVVILYKTFQNLKAIILLSKDLNFGNPFAQAFGLANLFMFLYLAFKRKFLLLAFSFLMIIYINGRSDPYTTTETDYQAIPYHYFSLFNGLLVLNYFWEELKNNVDGARKVVFGTSMILLGVFFLFLFLFLLDKGGEKAYKKYMGTQALIYDRPSIAPVLNKILTPQDYFYVGPYDPESYLYTKARLATKYHIAIPAMDESEKIRNETLEDFRRNKPRVIVFNTELGLFGAFPAQHIKDFLKQEYFTLDELKYERKFKLNEKKLGEFDFDRHFFFPKSQKDEIVNQLISLNLITPE